MPRQKRILLSLFSIFIAAIMVLTLMPGIEAKAASHKWAETFSEYDYCPEGEAAEIHYDECLSCGATRIRCSEGHVVYYAEGSSAKLYAEPPCGITTCIITYNKGIATSGTAPASQTKNAGESITLRKNTGNLSIPSAISKTSYTVSFNPNGGSCPTEFLTSTTEQGTNYTLAGWGTSKDSVTVAYKLGDTYSADASIMLYPVFFPSSYITQGNVTLPMPTRSGYTFKGWYTAASGGTKAGDAGDVYSPTANTTLYAQWTQNPATSYTITYAKGTAMSGTVPASQTKTKGKAIILQGNTGNLAIPGTKVKETYKVTLDDSNGVSGTSTYTSTKTTSTNYVMAGWGTNANSSAVNYKLGASYNEDRDITLYPIFEKETSVTQDFITLPNIVRPGYTFNGWYTAVSGGTKAGSGNSAYTPTANTTLYAQWTQNPATSYTITYAKGTATSGTVPASQIQDKGQKVNLQNNTGNLSKAPDVSKKEVTVTFETNGGECAESVIKGEVVNTKTYTITGWTTTPNGLKEYDFGETYTVNGNITLYPAFGIAGTVSSQLITFPKASRDGYTFDGWYRDKDLKYFVANAGDIIMNSENATFYAKWTKNAENTYTITYSRGTATSGTVPEKQTKTKGKNIVLQKNTGNLAIKGTSSKKSYKVSFNANGGNCSTEFLTSTTASGTNYVLAGWGTSANSTKVAYKLGGEYANDANITLYPVFYPMSYITAKAVKLPTPTRDGYTFTGWYTKASGGKKAGDAKADYLPDRNITLYAHWTNSAKTDISKLNIANLKISYAWTGKGIIPKAVIKNGTARLVKGRDYTVTVSNNVNIGKADLIIKGINSYKGTITKTFTIVPKATKITKTSTAKNAITLSWKKQAKQTTGYQIQYSLKKDFKSGSKTITIPNKKTTSRIIRNLKSNKIYYTRIRTYKTVKDTTYYSEWSDVRTVKAQ